MKNCKCIIRGRVQGVWFRRFTQEVANKLGVSGHVRNLPDGSVEVEASVPESVWEEFLQALHEGPPLAKVESIEIEPIEKTFSGLFEVLR
ncbi:acylphosphatase [Nitratiruptor sp. SB155-2]|uniref:acylphosphatase n=1 Tax=Nitratiruptor sp. (strain SB155-2) TaxID=387092 RepID=UPI0002D849DD|nr:acylphosphatase [Nitratiruptor sp. SB155-2]